MKLLVLGVLPTAFVLGCCLLAHLIRRHLSGRGEVAGVPEEPVPDVALEDARAAIDAVLCDHWQVNRRLVRLAAANRDLQDMAKQLEPFYLNGADR